MCPVLCDDGTGQGREFLGQIGNTPVRYWTMPPYTVGTWPYEEMYREEMQNPPGVTPHFDPVRRREAAQAFFAQLAADHSLVFYYANYSNPFSENDQQRYAIVGVSRLKAAMVSFKDSRPFFLFAAQLARPCRCLPPPTGLPGSFNTSPEIFWPSLFRLPAGYN